MTPVLLAASQYGYTMWRNNVGAGWMGSSRRLHGGSVLIESPRLIRFGLCEGSSDLIGFLPITITPDMVGQTVAVFAAIETKTPTGSITKKQAHFVDFVNKSGGIGIIARSPEDLNRAVTG